MRFLTCCLDAAPASVVDIWRRQLGLQRKRSLEGFGGKGSVEHEAKRHCAVQAFALRDSASGREARLQWGLRCPASAAAHYKNVRAARILRLDLSKSRAIAAVAAQMNPDEPR